MARELAAAVQKGGGLITADDLAHYEVKERAADSRHLSRIRHHQRAAAFVGRRRPGRDAQHPRRLRPGQARRPLRAESIHLIAEAFQRAFFDRAEFLGDPDFAKIPVAQLIDKRYGDAWRETIALRRATPSAATSRRPVQFFRSSIATPPRIRSRVPGREPHHTTHYSVVDAEGNAVSVTTTLNDGFGSRVTADGLGFLLNDEMDDFASKQGVPNMFGLIQGPANAIGPGKRPLSAMTPTIVLKDGKLFLVLGRRGGPTIITTVANVSWASSTTG